MSAIPYTQSYDAEYAQAAPRTWTAYLILVVLFVFRWTVGVVFTFSFFTSIFVVGWTYRQMQRYAVYRFVKLYQPKNAKRTFQRITQSNPDFQQWQSTPNWFLQQNAVHTFQQQWNEADGIWQSCKAVIRFPFYSLWMNLKIGAQALFNTYVLTIIPCLLWLFAWHAGWNNSFNKMYEQSNVGALTGILGIIIFAIIMLYVPMAQARQAVTGEWRAFYQFRTNWRLIRASWFYYAILALLFSLVSLPITVIKIAPGFIGQTKEMMTANDAEILDFLNLYFFITGFICLAGYIMVHLAAVRVYATAVKSALRQNLIEMNSLTTMEINVLQTVGAHHEENDEEPHIIIQATKWMGKKLKAAVCMIFILLFWLTFVFQIYVSSFLNYHTNTRAWMNQPLIHFPAFRYVPAHLNNQPEDAQLHTDEQEQE